MNLTLIEMVQRYNQKVIFVSLIIMFIAIFSNAGRPPKSQNDLAVFIKRQNRQCAPKVRLRNCNTKFENDPKWIWSRRQPYVIPSKVEKCYPKSKLKYSWSIINYETGRLVKDFKEFNGKSTFILNLFVLEFGRFVLTLKLTEITSKHTLETSTKCLIRIRAENPIPIILGGSSRTVPSNQNFRMEGNNSINMDAYLPNTTLYYRWWCKQEPEETFCEDFQGFDNYVIVPAKYAVTDSKFLFHMEVSTKQSPWFATEQTVYIKDGARQIFIGCLKNCHGKITHRLIVYLKAYCLNCPNGKYEWSMKPGEGNQKPSIDFGQETVFGKNSPKLMIKANVLVPGDTYEFIVSYDEGNSITSTTIKVDRLPKIGDCEVVPTEGTSLVTLFEVTCQNVSHIDPPVYRLFQRESGSSDLGVLLETNVDGNFEIYLSGGKSNPVELVVKIGDTNGLFDTKELKVSVTPLISDIPQDKQIETLMNEYQGKGSHKKSVQVLLENGDYETAIQLISGLTTEVQKLSNDTAGVKEFREKFRSMLVNDLLKFPVRMEDAPLKLSKIIGKLGEIDKQFNREFAKLSTKLCKKLALQQLENVLNSTSPWLLTMDTTEIQNDLLKTAESNMEPNPADLQREPVKFNLTTPFPPLSIPVLTEDYPNYDDCDLEYIKKYFDYRDITIDSVDIFEYIGRAVASTMSAGEPMVVIKDDSKVFQYKIDEAQLLVGEKFGAFGSSAEISKSMKHLEPQSCHVVSLAFAKNPLWWNLESQTFSAGVIYFSYYVSKWKPKNLGYPNEFFFNVKEFEMSFMKGSVSVPSDLNEWVPKNLNYNMSVHRIDVKSGTGLGVIFAGLTEKDKIQVVITHARRPNTKDFRNSTTITVNNSGLISSFPFDIMKYGDTWFYLGILPDKSMLPQTKSGTGVFTLKYNFALTSPTCVYWDVFSSSWSSKDCWTGDSTGPTMLHCQCKQASLHSGLYSTPLNKIDAITNVPYLLQLQINYVVFICVCVVFFIYCVALICSVKRIWKLPKEASFLADNLHNERFVYLIAVKTGKYYSAGTTAIVGLKIFGEKFSSRAHILNYPDPNEELLQRGGQDWFVLTTKRHLRDIEKIYLWHDSGGMRPNWYCESITIYDLPRIVEPTEWHFEVQKWFSVLKSDNCFVTLKPSSKKGVSELESNLLRKIVAVIKKEHTWNAFDPSSTFYVRRITLMFSITLSTYSFAIAFYGIPRFRLSDGLGEGHFSITFKTVSIAVLSSILSFLLHLIFLYFFKHPSASKVPLQWVLVISAIVVWMTFLIVYSFWVPYVTSLIWICATIGALIQIISLLENSYLCIKTFWLRKTLKASISAFDCARIAEQAQGQRSYLFEKFGPSSMRPFCLEKYQPLTREAWKIKKQEELARLKLAELVQDLIMFTIYLILLYVVVLASKDPLNIYSHQEMLDMVHGIHTRTMDFTDIQSVEDFYQYINETFLLTTHSIHWYGNLVLLDPGLLADFNTKILGVARFRQQRILEDSCEVPEETELLNLTCNPELTPTLSDVGEYMEYWEPKEFVAVPRLIGAWMYNVDAMPTLGEMTIYSSGGYSGPLGRTLYNSHYNLLYYEQTDWLDERTRAIFIEFLVYNANYNIFHAIKIIIEPTATGLFVKNLKVFTARLLLVDITLELMIAAVFMVFILVIFVMLSKNVYVAKKSWKRYVQETWNIVDFIIILMSFGCVGMYIYRNVLVGDLLDKLEATKHNQFISYFHLIYMEEAFGVLASALICVATIRVWKLLRFATIFRIMEKTLLLSIRPLLAITIWYSILLLGFTFSGYLIFGAYYKDFRNLTRTLTTLILVSLNLFSDFDYDLLEETYHGLGYTFYLLFMFCMLVIFTLYVAVLVLSYSSSSAYYSNYKESYTVQRYMKNEVKYFWKRFRRKVEKLRLSAGADHHNINFNQDLPKKVVPKDDEHRYANSVMVSSYRIFVMSLIARCILFSCLKIESDESVLSNYQAELMRQMIYHVLKDLHISEPKLIAFVALKDDEGLKLVFDKRILAIEEIVNHILKRGASENSQVVQFDKEYNEERLHNKNDKSEEIMFEDMQRKLKDFNESLKIISRIFDNIIVVQPQFVQYNSEEEEICSVEAEQENPN